MSTMNETIEQTKVLFENLMAVKDITIKTLKDANEDLQNAVTSLQRENQRLTGIIMQLLLRESARARQAEAQ